MANYKLQEMNDLRNTGRRTVYPKVVTNRTMDTNDIVEKMKGYNLGIAPSTTKAVLENISDILVTMLSMGYNVKLDGIGTFSLSIGFEDDKPKVAFADAVTSSSSCCLIGELAKVLAQNGYKIGQNRLFEWLRQHHYLGSKGEYYNMPYQKYIEQGIFKLSQKTFSQGASMKVGVTTVVTTKGQQYFINKFLSNQPTINFD